MMSLGPVAFAFPAALLALAAVPVLWWLLRVIPPAPLKVRFPPVRLVMRLTSTERSAQRTPPWLLALRLALAVAIILAVARPLINAASPLSGTGPVVIIVDNGWAAAPQWTTMVETMTGLVDRAEREQRPVILLPTAAEPDASAVLPIAAIEPQQAREEVRRLEPVPWPVARAAAVERLLASRELGAGPPGAIFWLTDGLKDPASTRSEMSAVAEALLPFGAVSVVLPEASALARVVRPPIVDGDRLTVPVNRAGTEGSDVGRIRAWSEDGRIVAERRVAFAAGQARAEAALRLPPELSNRIVRVALDSGQSAGAVVLLDERWRRRPIGIAGGRRMGGDLPLLSESYYLARALEPFAEVRRGTIPELLGRELAVLVVVDAAIADEEIRQTVRTWVEDGGVLLRFAGPRLAGGASGGDSGLLPIPLRTGDRVLGGSMAWREPACLAPFDERSPFSGLEIPDDVEIRRQVLAEPSVDLDRRTWARLDDGTPLVTAARRGKGWVVLFHTTANADWSTLPLSGLFVGMLERIVGLSRGAVAEAGGPPLHPVETLDGFGRLGPAPAEARAVTVEDFAETVPGPIHPPGLYGDENRRRSLNLSASLPDPVMIGALPRQVDRTGYGGDAETDLRPWLFALALALALADLAASIAMRGLLPTVRPLFSNGAPSPPAPGAAGALGRGRGVLRCLLLASAIASLATLANPTARAQEETVADGSAIPETLTTRLAYVRTGLPRVDEVSRAGLRGLSVVVNRRTAAELGDPVAVDPAMDELAFYPFIYWPLVAGAAAPSQAAASAIRDYMANGGTIVFDTRGRSGGGRAATGADMEALARTLHLPPLVPVPADHVLGRAYYLLSQYPGRWNGQVWVERAGETAHDGVTSVVASSNDWAGAWAVDEFHRPMLAVGPGEDRQREMAYRFGINLLMYVLTGNYKADQVHLPAIMERLGQ